MKLIHPHGGYGLGNELFVWGKGFVLSQALKAILLHPAWGNNPRRYHRYFRTSRFDYLCYRMLLRSATRYRFTEADYRRYGANDFVASTRAFIDQHDLRQKTHYIVEVTGFWGGLAV